MKRVLLLVFGFAFVLASCNTSFKKIKDGSGAEYKIIKNTSGKKAVKGNYMEVSVLVKYNDSTLMSSVESGGPKFMPYDTAQLPPFFKEINEGDSLIIRIKTDSLIKHGQAESFMKKGKYIYQCFKVSKLYNTQEESSVVEAKYAKIIKAKSYKKVSDMITKDIATVNAAQMKADDQILKDYFVKKGLQPTKTAWGTYVVLTNPGTGENLTSENIALVKYTGRTLKDTVFDSNVSKDPFPVDLGQFGVIPGWIDGLKLFKKGSVGKIIIPSSLAYGKNGSGPKVGPNENLVFDIEILDVITPEQYKQLMMAKQQEMMQKQQEMRESQHNPHAKP